MPNKINRDKLLALSAILSLTSGILSVNLTIQSFAEEFNVDTSTITFKNNMEVAEFLAQRGDKESLDIVFDGNQQVGIGYPIPVGAVSLNLDDFSSTREAVTQPKPASAKTKAPPPLSDKVSTEPKRLGELIAESNGTMVLSNGNMYRIAKESPAWKFWESGKVIERTVPNENGEIWTSRGEFVGKWEKVVKTDTDKFQVTKAADGKEHIYTTYNNTTVFLLSNEETKTEFERIFPDPEGRPWYYKKFGAVPRGWVNGEDIYINTEGPYLDEKDKKLLLEHENEHILGKGHEDSGVMADNAVTRYLTTPDETQ